MSPPVPSIFFLGYRVDRIDLPGTLRWIEDAVAGRQPRQITVMNANKLYLASRDARVSTALRDADLAIPEWAVVWGARRLGLPAVHHVGGITVAQALLPHAEQRGLSLYFLGGSPEVVEQLVRKVRTDYPKVRIAGSHHGFLSDAAIERAAIDEIRRAAPDVLFVAMGSPRQELWIHEQKATLGVPVSIGLGGTFDVLSGAKKDTPPWARGRGLEWLYRLAHDPRAYGRRYLVTNTWFVWQVFRASFDRTANAAH